MESVRRFPYWLPARNGFPCLRRITTCSASSSGCPSSASRSSISDLMFSSSSATMSLFRDAGKNVLTVCKYRSTISMFLPLAIQNETQRMRLAGPFLHQLLQDLPAFARKPVIALVAVVLFAPLAGQQSLRFQPADQRIKSPFIDLHAARRKCLTQRVAIVFRAKLPQNGQNQRSAPQLRTKTLQPVRVHFTVLRILYDTQY